jgi:hypothetical protein
MSKRRWNIETIKQVVEGENPFYQSGYTGKEKVKKIKVGEEWTDKKGIVWKKTSDGKIRVNKQVDAIREMIQKKCSICGCRIDFSCEKLDHMVFPKTGKCYDCLESEEMIIRLTGNWEKYEQLKMLQNKKGALKDFKEKVIETIEYLKNDNGVMGDVTSSGELITYTGKCNPQWLIDAELDLIKVNEELKNIETEISTLNSTTNK